MKIARVKRDLRIYQNLYPVPVFLKGGERYVMSDAILMKLLNMRSAGPDSIKEEKNQWSFEKKFRKYEGQDLNGKTLLCWRTGGIGDFCWVSASIHVLKQKYPDFHFIMACAPQYKAIIEACSDFDETFTLPLNAKLLNRSHWHAIFEGAVEQNPRAEQINCYDLFAERFFIKSEEYPIEWKRPWLEPQVESVSKLQQLWKTINLDPNAMKIGVQVKTSSPIRTPDFTFMVELIKIIKEKWPDAYIFIFDSPAHVQRVQKAIDQDLKPYLSRFCPEGGRVVNWLRLFQDLAVTIALVKELDLTIAPDSSINHLSAAFDVPNVGIFGGFKAEMRLDTYPYSDWVEIDYDKWKGCDLRDPADPTKSQNWPNSPCWSHSEFSCELSQQHEIFDHAICLDSIKIKDIMDKIDLVLDRKQRGVPRWEDVKRND